MNLLWNESKRYRQIWINQDNCDSLSKVITESNQKLFYTYYIHAKLTETDGAAYRGREWRKKFRCGTQFRCALLNSEEL